MSYADQHNVDWDGFFGNLAKAIVPTALGVQTMRENEYILQDRERQKKILDEIGQLTPPDMNGDGQIPANRDKFAQEGFNIYKKYGDVDGGMKFYQNYLQHQHEQLSRSFMYGLTAMKAKDLAGAAQHFSKAYQWLNPGPERVTAIPRNGKLYTVNYDENGNVTSEEPLTQDELTQMAFLVNNPDKFMTFYDNEANRGTKMKIAETNAAVDIATARTGAGSGATQTQASKDRQKRFDDIGKVVSEYYKDPEILDENAPPPVDPGLLHSQADNISQYNGDRVTPANAVQAARAIQEGKALYSYNNGRIIAQIPGGLPVMIPMELVPQENLDELLAKMKNTQAAGAPPNG